MDTNMPENLMDNVERKIRKHVKEKRKNIRRAAAVLIGFATILPTSVFVYAQYADNILYKQEIDLARENNDVIKENKTFKYKDVAFTIKEIVADTTGMEVVYEVSDPKYYVSEISLGDKDNKKFQISGSENLDIATSKEKSFYVEFDSEKVRYMKNNPITININSIEYTSTHNTGNILDKIYSVVYGSDKCIRVEWALKTKIAMKEIKSIAVNKEFALDIGTLKINSLDLGIIKSKFSYSFIPKDTSIISASPKFCIELGNKKYVDGSAGEGSEYFGTREFDSVYYQNIAQIGIKLVAIDVNYNSNDSKVYKINNDKLPMKLNYNGEKIAITAYKKEKNAIKYTVQYAKTNRRYSQIYLKFCNQSHVGGDDKLEKLQYIDQPSRDKVYVALVKKVPILKDIDYLRKNGDGFQDGVISSQITIYNKKNEEPLELKISGASKELIYDEDEIVIDNLLK